MSAGRLIGAGFAPLVALFLASRFGVWSVGIYLLSGAICTVAALALNREWGRSEADGGAAEGAVRT